MIDSLQSVIEKIDARIRERSKAANKARRKGLANSETMYLSQILGLIDARNFLLEEIERLNNEAR